MDTNGGYLLLLTKSPDNEQYHNLSFFDGLLHWKKPISEIKVMMQKVGDTRKEVAHSASLP